MQRNEAEEHLRVIRSLMEKATIYRAISAPTALVGGLVATVGGGVVAWSTDHSIEGRTRFIATWLCVLIITAVANAWFLRRDAHRRREKFVSLGMKMALTTLLPSHLVAGVATLICFSSDWFNGYLLLPYIWAISYGVGLLAMAHFAPRSIVRLGWAFLATGLALVAIGFCTNRWFFASERASHGLMALTFGLFHLIYAACAWPRGAAKTDAN